LSEKRFHLKLDFTNKRVDVFFFQGKGSLGVKANLLKRGQKGGLAHQRVTQHFDRVIYFFLTQREQQTRQTANELEVLQLP